MFNMRKAPMTIAALFLGITLFRVAAYSAEAMKAGIILGTLFSAGLGLSVFVSAYHARVHGVDRNGEETRQSIAARKTAFSALVLFAIADGLFNLWEVQRNVTDPNLATGVYIYGLFPTAAAALLGFVQGKVDKLPMPPIKQKHARFTASTVVVAFLSRALRIDVKTLEAVQQQEEAAALIAAAPVAVLEAPAVQHAQLQNGNAVNAQGTVFDVQQAAYAVHEQSTQNAEYAAAPQAAAVKPVTLLCSICSDPFTGDTARAANAKRAAHMRWTHPEAKSAAVQE